MKARWIIPILLVLWLSACTPTATPVLATLAVVPSAAPSPEPTLPPVILPTAILTASPAPAPTATAALTATPLPKPSATPQSTAIPPTPPAPNAVPVAPDCARFPNFGPCGGSVSLTGRLAVFDPQRQVIQILDFQNKIDLEVKAPAGTHTLQWTNQGNTLVALSSENLPTLAWSNPVASSLPLLPPRSPQGAAVFTAADASTAWLEQKNGQFLIHVRLAGAAQEQVWPVESQASDKQHILLGWVPGTNLLLGGTHYSGNSMWVTGNSLYTIDSRSGVIKELKASLRLGGNLQWHPSQAGLLLFGNSSDAPAMGSPRPALLDVVSGKLTPLVADENVVTSALSWTRQGQTILFAAKTVGQAPKAGAPFATAAIYQLDWPGGTPRALTKLAISEQDDWPQPLPDGQRFFYVRILSDAKTAELRLGALDGSLDARIATGLSVSPATGLSGFQWETMLAYTP